MSKSNKGRILKPELSIHKKLGKVKFDQVYDKAAIARAEKVVADKAPLFNKKTLKDFAALKKLHNKAINESRIDGKTYNKIAEVAFSIKSRAGTGGFPLASEVANSLYKFCEDAAKNPPRDAGTALKLHVDALEEIFENKFAVNDSQKGKKLIKGLEAISRKFLNH